MSNQPEIQAAYLKAHAKAMAMLALVEMRIHDMPAPDSVTINYEHVGEMARIASELEAIASRA